MNKQLFDSLDRIDEALLNIDVKVKAIHEKLDELIAALHNYDDGLEMFEDEPKQGACSKHDAASWDEEEQLNKRMDIIGQNGNTGEHYTSEYDDYSSFKRNKHKDEFDDYGKRIEGKDKNKSNNPAKHVGKKKSAYDKHMKYPPHKH
jgi:predicted DNA-binding protein YlxM (UPF0122 family)